MRALGLPISSTRSRVLQAFLFSSRTELNQQTRGRTRSSTISDEGYCSNKKYDAQLSLETSDKYRLSRTDSGACNTVFNFFVMEDLVPPW